MFVHPGPTSGGDTTVPRFHATSPKQLCVAAAHEPPPPPPSPRLNLRFGHCLSLWKLPLYMQMGDLIQGGWKLISGFWCGNIKGFIPSGRGPGDSMFKQSEAHMSTRSILVSLKPVAESSHTLGSKVPSICSRHFRHLLSFNSRACIYRTWTKQR